MKPNVTTPTPAQREAMNAVRCVRFTIHEHMEGLMNAHNDSHEVSDLDSQLSCGLITQIEYFQKRIAAWEKSPEYTAWSKLEAALHLLSN